jgi:hypothetical protein
MVGDHDVQVKQLHSLVVKELLQLLNVSIEIHRDYSLLIFDHQYEDLFEKLNRLEESIKRNFYLFSVSETRMLRTIAESEGLRTSDGCTD